MMRLRLLSGHALDLTLDNNPKPCALYPAPMTSPTPIRKIDLQTSGDGKTLKTLNNVVELMTMHPAWKGVVQWSELHERVMVTKRPPFRDSHANRLIWDGTARPWTDADTARTVVWVEIVTGMSPGQLVDKALETVAQASPYHPIRDYLEGLEWDNAPRLEQALSRYYGATDSPYLRAVGRAWFVSMVARVMDPGCKVDTMVILEGQQGRGKSTGLRALMHDPEWFSDTLLPIGSKDAYQQLSGVWLYEMAELDGLRAAEWTEIKGFLSAGVDKFRRSYGRHETAQRRQTVFAGTTNRYTYLEDPTGGRRFWPVRCGGSIDVEAITRDRDQLWAEALTLYRARTPWHLPRDLTEPEQQKRQPEELWEGLIVKWLEPSSVYYKDGIGQERSAPKRDGLLMGWVAAGALGLTSNQMHGKNYTRCRDIMEGLGWELRDGRWFEPLDGTQEIPF